MSRFYAGLDIGTTGSKITIFEDTKSVKQLYISYDSNHQKNQHTIDPKQILDSVFKLVSQGLKLYPIEAIGIASFGETFVLLDKNDEPLYNALLYTDARGDIEAKKIEETIGQNRLGEITGQRGRAMFSLSKILNLIENQEVLIDDIDKILLIEDYISYAFTGKRKIDYSLSSRTMAFDIEKKKWSEEILNTFKIPISLFSTPCPIGDVVGLLKDSLKKEWKIEHDVKIIAVSHDQVVNAIGSGIINEKAAADGNGTCECICACIKPPFDKEILYNKGFGIVPFIEDNLYVTYALSSTSGSLVKWVIDTFFKNEKHRVKNIYDYLNRKITSFPSEVMILPHFAGAATPYMDVNAKGAIVNLGLATSRYEIYQACLESLCYEMLISIRALKKAGIKINYLVASGGSSVNDKFLQMKADIFNIKIYQSAIADAGTIGSAIVVAKSIGIFKNYEEGINQMVRYKKVFIPDLKRHHDYMIQFDKYRKLFLKMKEVR